jgi:hypothetical protein
VACKKPGAKDRMFENDDLWKRDLRWNGRLHGVKDNGLRNLTVEYLGCERGMWTSSLLIMENRLGHRSGRLYIAVLYHDRDLVFLKGRVVLPEERTCSNPRVDQDELDTAFHWQPARSHHQVQRKLADNQGASSSLECFVF